ncbi:MAG: transketolase C-terminal domain-containing protein, partial [Phocaeicola sp.]
NGPKLLHIYTTKGKGFEPAEKAATVWHAPGIFDKETGERVVHKTEGLPPLFQDVFGKTLLELAKENAKIVGVTPAMPSGCSMNLLMKAMPDRGFDVGIAEGHAVTFSGGMAERGLIPFCNIYSSFMQRAYDNVIHDVAIQKLPVVFCLDRAGLVGEDGPTHHGFFDLAYMRAIPHMVIASPYDEHELRHLMYTAQYNPQGPFVIRYPRGRGSLPDWNCPMQLLPIGKGRTLQEGSDVAVITLGPIGPVAARAIAQAQECGTRSIAHYDLRFLKPLDHEMLHEIGKKFSRIVTVEDGVLKGGMGSAILEFMADHEYTPRIKRIGLPDTFVQHGSVQELHRICGTDQAGIYRVLLSI